MGNCLCICSKLCSDMQDFYSDYNKELNKITGLANQMTDHWWRIGTSRSIVKGNVRDMTRIYEKRHQFQLGLGPRSDRPINLHSLRHFSCALRITLPPVNPVFRTPVILPVCLHCRCRVSATLSCPMRLHKFPLDTQSCPMMFESCKCFRYRISAT